MFLKHTFKHKRHGQSYKQHGYTPENNYHDQGLTVTLKQSSHEQDNQRSQHRKHNHQGLCRQQ